MTNKKNLSGLTKAQLIQLIEAQGEPDTQEEDLDIRADEYIQVMSLTPWQLNLSTGQAGRRPYNFKEMFAVKRIMYKDIVEILETRPTFAEKGLYVILDERVIRKHGLEEYYDNILTKDDVLEIFNGDFEKSLALFKTANERQQKNIVSSIISKIVKEDKEFDKNLIYAMSQETGINILEVVEDRKALTVSSK